VLGGGGQIITQNLRPLPGHADAISARIDVLLIEVGEPPTGVGEVSVPTAAAALTSAIAGTGSGGFHTKTIRVF
jgi:isoquinoline 1-oxidoreductase subunit beta